MSIEKKASCSTSAFCFFQLAMIVPIYIYIYNIDYINFIAIRICIVRILLIKTENNFSSSTIIYSLFKFYCKSASTAKAVTYLDSNRHFTISFSTITPVSNICIGWGPTYYRIYLNIVCHSSPHLKIVLYATFRSLNFEILFFRSKVCLLKWPAEIRQ